MDPSGLGSLFKLFLGFPEGRRNHEDRMEEEHPRENLYRGDPENRGRTGDEAELYRVFTDPLEMSRFFEEQMDDMLRNFGQGFFGGSMRSGPLGPYGGGLSPLPPQLLPPEEDDGSKRDFMLKDEGQPSLPRLEKREPKLDEDLSEQWESVLGSRTGTGGLGRQGDLFKDEETEPRVANIPMRRGFGLGSLFPGMREGQIVPEGGGGGGFHSWGVSISQSTVRGQDGTVETTRTERNSDGSERVTVTRTDPSGNTVTETKQTGNNQENEGWQVVPRGGMEVPGPREEMLAPPPEDRLYSHLWDKFFGK